MDSAQALTRACCRTRDQRDTLVKGPSEARRLREQSAQWETLVVPVIYFLAWAPSPRSEVSRGGRRISTSVDPGRGPSSSLRSHTGLEVGVMSEPATAPLWHKTTAAHTAATHTSHQGAL
jgi:hypothetical protein